MSNRKQREAKEDGGAGSEAQRLGMKRAPRTNLAAPTMGPATLIQSDVVIWSLLKLLRPR